MLYFRSRAGESSLRTGTCSIGRGSTGTGGLVAAFIIDASLTRRILATKSSMSKLWQARYGGRRSAVVAGGWNSQLSRERRKGRRRATRFKG